MSVGVGQVLKIASDNQLQQFIEELNKSKIALTLNTMFDYCLTKLITFDEFVFENDCLAVGYLKQCLQTEKNKMFSSPQIIEQFQYQLSNSTSNAPKEFTFFLEEIGYQFTPPTLTQFVKSGTESELRTLGRESKQSNVCILLSADGTFARLLACVPEGYVSKKKDIKIYAQLYRTNHLFYTKQQFNRWFRTCVLRAINFKRQLKKYYGEVFIVANTYFFNYLACFEETLRMCRISVLLSPQTFHDPNDPFVKISESLENYIADHCSKQVLIDINQYKFQVDLIIDFLMANTTFIRGCCYNYLSAITSSETPTQPSNEVLPEKPPSVLPKLSITIPMGKTKSISATPPTPVNTQTTITQNESSTTSICPPINTLKNNDETNCLLAINNDLNSQNLSISNLIPQQPTQEIPTNDIILPPQTNVKIENQGASNGDMACEPNITPSAEPEIKKEPPMVIDIIDEISVISISDGGDSTEQDLSQDEEFESIEEKEDFSEEDNNSYQVEKQNDSEDKGCVQKKEERENNNESSDEDEQNETQLSLSKIENNMIITPLEMEEEEDQLCIQKQDLVAVKPNECKYNAEGTKYVELEIRMIKIKEEVIEELYGTIQEKNNLTRAPTRKKETHSDDHEKKSEFRHKRRKKEMYPKICESVVFKEPTKKEKQSSLVNAKGVIKKMNEKGILVSKKTFKLICKENLLNKEESNALLKEVKGKWKSEIVEMNIVEIKQKEITKFVNDSMRLLNNMPPELVINCIDIGKHIFEGKMEVLEVNGKKIGKMDVESRMSWIIVGITGGGDQLPSLCCLPKDEIEELKLVFNNNVIFVENNERGINKNAIEIWIKEAVIPFLNNSQQKEGFRMSTVLMVEEGLKELIDMELFKKQKVKVLVVPKGAKEVMPIAQLEDKIEIEWLKWGELARKNKETLSFGALNELRRLRKKDIIRMFEGGLKIGEEGFEVIENGDYEGFNEWVGLKIEMKDLYSISIRIKNNIDAVTTFYLEDIPIPFRMKIEKIVRSKEFIKFTTKKEQVEYCFEQFPSIADILLKSMRASSKKKGTTKKRKID